MHAYAAIVNLSESVHSDLTGRFPVQSRRGNNYVYVSVYKGYIHAEVMPSRTAAAYVKAVTRTRSWFADRGIHITIHRVDNETSRDVERLLRELPSSTSRLITTVPIR
jgi:predicted phosphoadenosine phosphosulfate sulfurtransferase